MDSIDGLQGEVMHKSEKDEREREREREIYWQNNTGIIKYCCDSITRNHSLKQNPHRENQRETICKEKYYLILV